MQRCPYIHEMKERLLGEQIQMEQLPKKVPEPPPFIMDQQQLLQQQPVATVVRVREQEKIENCVCLRALIATANNFLSRHTFTAPTGSIAKCVFPLFGVVALQP